jgi:hypothetical protein
VGTRRVWVGVLIAATVAAGCGGGGKSRFVTVEGIAGATQATKTARFSLSADALETTLTGEADFARHRYRLHVDLPEDWLQDFPKDDFRGGIPDVWRDASSTLDAVLLPGHEFVRGFVFGNDWCEDNGPSHTDPSQLFGLDPASAISSLHPPEILERVGNEVVHDVATTHYRVLHAPAPNDEIPSPSEVWVDDKDQLRRAIEAFDQRDGKYYLATVEFSDFGADLTPIEAPTTKRCEEP